MMSSIYSLKGGYAVGNTKRMKKSALAKISASLKRGVHTVFSIIELFDNTQISNQACWTAYI